MYRFDHDLTTWHRDVTGRMVINLDLRICELWSILIWIQLYPAIFLNIFFKLVKKNIVLTYRIIIFIWYTVLHTYYYIQLFLKSSYYHRSNKIKHWEDWSHEASSFPHSTAGSKGVYIAPMRVRAIHGTIQLTWCRLHSMVGGDLRNIYGDMYDIIWDIAKDVYMDLYSLW